MAEVFWQGGRKRRTRRRKKTCQPPAPVLGCVAVSVVRREVLLPFTMAGSLFARLSLEEGDSANSLEVLEMKLGVEGKNQKSPLDQFSRARSFPLSSKWR